jgi:hypothetical protein
MSLDDKIAEKDQDSFRTAAEEKIQATISAAIHPLLRGVLLEEQNV